jgi:His-Xaa-Ser system protein HxsD
MSDPATILDPSRVEIGLDERAFPRDAIYGAAYSFIDRYYVRLHRAAEGRIGIVLRAKTGGALDAEAVTAELHGELFAQAFRERLAEEGRDLTASIFAGAHGGTDGASSHLDPGDLSDLHAFDDPLGIALSWEETQAKTPSHDGGSAPKPPGEGAT